MLDQANRQLITAHSQIIDKLIPHYSLIPDELWPWPNFRPSELACPRTGQLFYNYSAVSKIQHVRHQAGRPIYLSSAHRSEVHNARVGGAPLSEHLKMAFDVPLMEYDRLDLLVMMYRAGFRSFGLYKNFIHCDERQGRMWFGSKIAKAIWIHALRERGIDGPALLPSYLENELDN